MDEGFLRSVGLYKQVRNCLKASKWPGLLTLKIEIDVVDTCEFLASLTYEGSTGDHGSITDTEENSITYR